jgi:S1-C subfamily serine protease
VIVAVEKEEVSSMSGLVVALREREPGDQVALELVRDGDRRQVTVDLVERPS